MKSTPWFLPVLAAAVVFACKSEEEKPPPPTCVGNCGRPPMVGIGLPSGGAGSEPEGGEGGSNGAGVAITGTVELLIEDGRFDSGSVFTDNAEIRTTSSDGIDVKTTWDGLPPYLLDNVVADTTAWVLITPQNPQADDAAITLEPVLTSGANALGQIQADLGIVRDSTVEGFFDVLSMPLQRDVNAAQIVLRLKQRSGGGAFTGIGVHATTAADVVYGVNGGYSDVETVTDATGIAVLLNVPAAAYPGALVAVTFSGAASGGAQVRAVSGAVSLVTLLL